MYVSRQAIKIKTNEQKEKEYILHKMEASAASRPLLRWWLKERERSPKTGLLIRMKQAEPKTQASSGNNRPPEMCLCKQGHRQGHSATLWRLTNCGSCLRCTISPVFSPKCSRLYLDQITIWNPTLLCWVMELIPLTLKKCTFRQRCTRGRWKHINTVDFN